MKELLVKYWFVVALFGVVGLAFLFPAPGAAGGVLHTDVTTRAAVAVIFVIQGAVLALESLRKGLSRWRLHGFVQTFTYIVFPLLGMGLDAAFGRFLSPELRLGFLFLAVLPTTVSTAIVFTALAGGNAAGALVNATLSNILGVVITPLWIGLLLEVKGQGVPVVPLIRELALLIVAPLVLGQLLRPFIKRWLDAQRAYAGHVSSLVVLFIVYAAFCNSVHSGVFTTGGWRLVLVAGLGAAGLFALVMVLTGIGVRLCGLAPADATAAFFCAPQKTLASGVPMAKLIFAANPAIGIILLPVMFYHPIQLLVGGVLVGFFKARNHEANDA